MTRADIANKIALATGLSKVETETVVEGFILCVIDALFVACVRGPSWVVAETTPPRGTSCAP